MTDRDLARAAGHFRELLRQLCRDDEAKRHARILIAAIERAVAEGDGGDVVGGRGDG